MRGLKICRCAAEEFPELACRPSAGPTAAARGQDVRRREGAGYGLRLELGQTSERSGKRPLEEAGWYRWKIEIFRGRRPRQPRVRPPVEKTRSSKSGVRASCAD